MKKLILAIAAIAALSALAAGCVKMNLNTTLQDTGAGSLDLTFAFAPGVLEALKDLESSPGAVKTDKMPDLNALDRTKLEESCRRAGVTLAAYERTTVGGSERTHVNLVFRKFDDLNGVLEPAGDPQGGLRLYKLPNGNYTIRVGPEDEKAVAQATADAKRAAEEATQAASDAARAPDGAVAPQGGQGQGGSSPAAAPAQPDSAAVQRSMAAIGKLVAAAGELEMTMRFTVPGDVISHNATRVEGRTLIWEINSGNMMTEGANLQPEIVFSGKGLSLDAPVWRGAATAGSAGR